MKKFVEDELETKCAVADPQVRVPVVLDVHMLVGLHRQGEEIH